MTAAEKYDLAVVGAGPAGLASALALALTGLEIALIAPPHRPSAGEAKDNRTAALFAGSIALLRNLGAWRELEGVSEPINAIRIVDDTGSLLRAPEVVFRAGEIGLDAFGWNVPNHALVVALERALDVGPMRVHRIATSGVARIEPTDDAARLILGEGTSLDARLVVGADGRRSVCRSSAKISERAWAYPQSALATSFTHTRPHSGISTELHGVSGPCTTVPLPGLASSLVWVERPEEASRLAGLDATSFARALEAKLQGLLGSIEVNAPRVVFPLSGLTTDPLGRCRIALVGEAAHVIPPIGAQGLNLGLRDAAALADCVADALRAGSDPGAQTCLDAYTSARRPDIGARVLTVDALNRSLLSDFLPVHLARGFGLHALKAIAPLRRLVVREGLHPSYSMPSLMQADGSARLRDRCGLPHVAA